MTQEWLRGRALGVVVLTAVLGAVIAAGAALGAQSMSAPRYRAEMQVALVPGRQVPPPVVADYWEALSRGQAARIGAEVLAQRRWMAPAAQSAGVPVDSVSTSAGAVGDTTLINVAAEAGSPAAAEAAVGTVLREARPLVEQVSGPFSLEVVQDPGGSAVRLGTSRTQLLAVAAIAGLLIGTGAGLLVAGWPRWRARLSGSSDGDGRAARSPHGLDPSGTAAVGDDRMARLSVPGPRSSDTQVNASPVPPAGPSHGTADPDREPPRQP
jgi:hypothetical protein